MVLRTIFAATVSYFVQSVDSKFVILNLTGMSEPNTVITSATHSATLD